MGGVPAPGAVFEGWNALWEGALAVHDPRLVLEVERRPEDGGGIVWNIRPRNGSRNGEPFREILAGRILQSQPL